MTNGAPPPPGWHPAPDRPGQMRYWDGTTWTDDYSPGAAQAMASTGPQPVKQSHTLPYNTHAPGWYPDNAGVVRYWDGTQFLSGAPPASERPQKNIGIGLGVGGAAVAIGLVGLLMSLSSASLLTGTGTQWTGFALSALAAVGSVIASMVLWRKIHLGVAIANIVLPTMIALLALASVIYLEVQMEERRQDLDSIFED